MSHPLPGKLATKFKRWWRLPLNERIGAIPAQLGRRVFERRYGIDISGRVDLSELGEAAEGRAFFISSDWVTIRRTLKRLDVTPEDVIVDFGSGKGGVVLPAAKYTDARRVVGIEIGGELHEQAVQNRDRMRGAFGATEVELIHGDAIERPIPDDMTIVYLFSPFYGELMDRFIAVLLESVDRVPRTVRVVYSYPFEHNRLIATGRFVPIDVIATKLPYRQRTGDNTVVTYVIVPKGAQAPAPYAEQARRRLKGAEAWTGPHSPGFKLIYDTGQIRTPDEEE